MLEKKTMFTSIIYYIENHDRLFNTVSSLLLAIFTGTLVIATWRLWEATQSLVTGSEANAIKQLRAYVDFSSYRTVPTVDSSNKVTRWSIIPEFENSGSTPTVNAVSHVNSKTFPAGDSPASTEFADVWAKDEPHKVFRMTMAPRTVRLGAAADIPIEAIDTAIATHARIFVWGWIDYNDVFPGTPRHRTEFCLWLDWPGSPHDAKPMNAKLQFCSAFNGADEETLRAPQPDE